MTRGRARIAKEEPEQRRRQQRQRAERQAVGDDQPERGLGAPLVARKVDERLRDAQPAQHFEQRREGERVGRDAERLAVEQPRQHQGAGGRHHLRRAAGDRRPEDAARRGSREMVPSRSARRRDVASSMLRSGRRRAPAGARPSPGRWCPASPRTARRTGSRRRRTVRSSGFKLPRQQSRPRPRSRRSQWC